jgi:1-acyl-sn-glycerol-3-phosphate acyltransferase
VLVCNHQSNFDAPFVFARLPKHVRFVAKQELYRIPIFGAAIKAMGNIRVERTGSDGDRKRIEAAIEQVRTRTSILFFAEGTRSTDGKLRSFKKGAAVLAIDAQVPLVPVAVAGAHEITPKGGLWVHSGRPLVLRVGKPIPTTGLGRGDRDTLTRQAHDAVAALLEDGNQRVQEMLAT